MGLSLPVSISMKNLYVFTFFFLCLCYTGIVGKSCFAARSFEISTFFCVCCVLSMIFQDCLHPFFPVVFFYPFLYLIAAFDGLVRYIGSASLSLFLAWTRLFFLQKMHLKFYIQKISLSAFSPCISALPSWSAFITCNQK